MLVSIYAQTTIFGVGIILALTIMVETGTIKQLSKIGALPIAVYHLPVRASFLPSRCGRGKGSGNGSRAHVYC